jgi:Cofilin/tropomyosin-type actin-binding protein
LILWLCNDASNGFPELPENSPRYVVLSYELGHKDGRKSFPLVLVNWAPTSSETGLLTLHASALLDFQTTVRGLPSKVHNVLTFDAVFPFARRMCRRLVCLLIVNDYLSNISVVLRSSKSAMVQSL